MRKRRFSLTRIVPFLARAARFSFKSQILTVWVVLCALGFFVGLQARPDPRAVPYEELAEGLSVRSFRDSPSDTAAQFVVELAARGRVFRQYDVDSRRFIAPVEGRDYRRSISGTRYPALRVRGHVDRGMWLEMPDSTRPSLLPGEFDELYRTTLGYVRPISIVTNVVSMLSGYSIGYRVATWSTSLSNPAVQERVLATPGIGRAIAREAWKRVLLEPAVAVQESDAARFASASGTQRIYTNFFRLAVSDSNGFIPAEAARLDSAGCAPEAHAIRAFARAVRCAVSDTCDLTSADFSAVEAWASLLDRRGHWSYRSVPASAQERIRYLGTLAWYGIAPEPGGIRRLWVGPRLLVQTADAQGFVPDDIPSVAAGCPISWRAWLRGDATHPSGNAWTAQWMAESRQFAPVVSFAVSAARAWRASARPATVPDQEEDEVVSRPQAASAHPAAAPRVAIRDTSRLDSTRVEKPVTALPDSAAALAARADSVPAAPPEPPHEIRVIRANSFGPNP